MEHKSIRMTLTWLLKNGTQGEGNIRNMKTKKINNIDNIISSDDMPILKIGDLILLLKTCVSSENFSLLHKKDAINYTQGIREHTFKCSFSGAYRPRGKGVRIHSSPKTIANGP